MQPTQIASPVNAAVTGAFAVNASVGSSITRVSGQWAMRPDDQKFLNLAEVEAYAEKIYSESFADVLDVRDVRVTADKADPNDLRLVLPTHQRGEIVADPTNWSFGQLCSLVSVPAGYLRKLPGTIAGINLQYGLRNFREETVKAYVRVNGETELRAATGPEYGRVFDVDVVRAVRRIAGRGDGTDSHWKVPGMLDWATGTYNPFHPVTKATTTLFASDRDVFLFLVDDTHPIEIGTIQSGPHAGKPDLIFRGFMVWNSETGSKTLGVATFYLRGVCCNRIIWGAEQYSEITLRHSKGAPMRFDAEVRPALESYANAATGELLAGIKAARETIVARTKDERSDFLVRQGFTKPEAKKVIDLVIEEEGIEPSSIWDYVQGITAAARSIPYQDDRVAFERRATKLLDKVAA